MGDDGVENRWCCGFGCKKAVVYADEKLNGYHVQLR